MLKKYLFVFGLIVPFFVQAQDVKEYHFLHQSWEEILTVEGNRLCRVNGDCATVVEKTAKEMTLKWDNWGSEKFIYAEHDNVWIAFVSGDIKKKIQEEYENFAFTFDEPYIKLNPYGVSPLSALLKFETDDEVKISMTIKGKDGAPDIVFNGKTYETVHEFPVLGLYPNYDNTLILSSVDKKGNKKTSQHTIKTAGTDIISQWFVTNKKDKQFNYYANYDGLVYDELGNLRYVLTPLGERFIYFYKDKVYGENESNIYRYDMLGLEEQVYHYPKDFYTYRHGISFKDNGNLLVFGSYNNSKALIDGKEVETQRDFILELDQKTGKVLNEYDLAEMINPDRSLIIKSSTAEHNKVDWAHTNGIAYDDKTRSVIVSGRHFGAVKIDEKTKKAIWWLTPHQQTHKSGRKGDKGDVSHLLLTAVDKNLKPYPKEVQEGTQYQKDFKWPLKTHSIKYWGNGMYSIFDNSGDMWDKKLYTTANSVASIFKIDDKKKTLQQVFLKHLPGYSELGSSVILHPKTKDIFVLLSRVRIPQNDNIANGIILRYNQKGEELYRAYLFKKTTHWTYLIQPFEFYAENNWTTPVY